jgi:hypothetical protein
MCVSQSKVLSLLQPPVWQLPLFWQPFGAPSEVVPEAQDVQAITVKIYIFA